VQQIVAAHLFGAAPSTAAEGRPEPLELLLQGTIAGDEPAAGQAIIRMHDKKARVFNAGQDIDPNTQLLRVYIDHVVINYLGAEQTLALPQSGLLASLLRPLWRGQPARAEQVEELQPGHAVEPVVREANYASIVEYAEFLPTTGRGGTLGVKVTGIKDPEQMARVGLQDGDVITALNGEPLKNPTQIAQLLEALSHGGAVNVSVEHDGQATDLALQAVD
jgi:type II secretion system protein C